MDDSDILTDDLRAWFGKGKKGGVGGGGWDRYNTKGERIGKCAAPERGAREGKPKCLSKEKAAQLRAKGGKQAIANAVKRKKAQDPVTDRPGTGNVPKFVSNRIKESTMDQLTEMPNLQGMWNKIAQKVVNAPQTAKDQLRNGALKLKQVLSVETAETKKMLDTVNKLLKNEPVSPQEKKEATLQFLDLLKTIGVLPVYKYFFWVPGITEIILVIAFGIKRLFGINILPSAAMVENLHEWAQRNIREEQTQTFTFKLEDVLFEKNASVNSHEKLFR